MISIDIHTWNIALGLNLHVRVGWQSWPIFTSILIPSKCGVTLLLLASLVESMLKAC